MSRRGGGAADVQLDRGVFQEEARRSSEGTAARMSRLIVHERLALSRRLSGYPGVWRAGDRSPEGSWAFPRFAGSGSLLHFLARSSLWGFRFDP